MTTPVDKGAVDISEEAFEGVRENLRDIMHLAEQGGWIESAAGEAIEFIHALRSALTADGKRLEWAMRHIPGSVFSRLGVIYSDGVDRDAVDAAMTLEESNGR